MQEMFYDANAFNKMPVGWDTSKVTDSMIYFILQTHGMRGSRAATTHPPRRGWTRKDNACDASLPPVNGAVGNCTDTLVSGTSCVPTCDPGYVLEGVTSCTDRVLTEAVCTLDVTTRAELKAAVDACVGDRLCEGTMPHWDVSRVTDMSLSSVPVASPGEAGAAACWRCVRHQPVGDVAGDGRAWYVPWRL